MKYTSAFIFSIGLLLCAGLSQAQETEVKTKAGKTDKVAVKAVPKEKLPEEKKKDTIPPKLERYGAHVGIDLYKLTRSFYDNQYKGLELVADYRLTKKIYLAGELGNENKTTDDDRLGFTTKGTYFKVGFDSNTYENWLDMENMVTIGLRYGVSSFSQQLNSYEIYNPHPYFGEVPVIVSGEKFNGLSASWIEVVAGVKVELFKNLFAGFSLRLNRIVSNKLPENFDNLYIPGYGRTYNGDFGANFNYTVSYFIPIYKKKAVPVEKKEKPKPRKKKPHKRITTPD